MFNYTAHCRVSGTRKRWPIYGYTYVHVNLASDFGPEMSANNANGFPEPDPGPCRLFQVNCYDRFIKIPFLTSLETATFCLAEPTLSTNQYAISEIILTFLSPVIDGTTTRANRALAQANGPVSIRTFLGRYCCKCNWENYLGTKAENDVWNYNNT